MRAVIGVIMLILLASLVAGQPIGFRDYGDSYVSGPSQYGGYGLIDLAFYGVLALFLFAVCLYGLGVATKMKKKPRISIAFLFAWLAVFGIMRMARDFKFSEHVGGDYAVLIIVAAGAIAAFIIFNTLE